jgi:hypothetical protein
MTTGFLSIGIVRFALLCGALVLLSTIACAQYRFDSWTTDSGLPVNCIDEPAQAFCHKLFLNAIISKSEEETFVSSAINKSFGSFARVP